MIMKVSYSELKQKVSGDLMGVGVPQAGKGKVLFVQDSQFTEVPEGAKVRTRSVSFSKLSVGDFVLVSTDNKMSVRRFIKVSLNKGNTRLVMVDGHNNEESVPFTRLIGRVESVRFPTANVDPNPKSFLHRAAFRVKRCLSSGRSVA
jgi:hypothetical protein